MNLITDIDSTIDSVDNFGDQVSSELGNRDPNHDVENRESNANTPATALQADLKALKTTSGNVQKTAGHVKDAAVDALEIGGAKGMAQGVGGLLGRVSSFLNGTFWEK